MENDQKQDVAVGFVQSTADLIASICTPAIVNVKKEMISILQDNQSTIDDLKNEIEKLKNPDNKVVIDGKDVHDSIIPLTATSYKINKKKGYITYFTDVESISLEDGYNAIIISPNTNKDVRAYLVSNEVEFVDGKLVVIYRSTDRYNTIPYESGEVVGKLIFVK